MSQALRVGMHLVVGFVLYVLSYGPVDRLWFYGMLSASATNVVMAIYSPLGSLCPTGTPMGDVLHQYCIFWRLL
ncbi:MAG TPA: hypothetical protein VML55_24265 [Planctomycetaceae bacterium]|nr:hypothetical protein [Planctomycetaceae bacterium]